MLNTLTRKKNQLNQHRYNSEVFVGEHRQVNESKTGATHKRAKISQLQLLLELDAVREFERQRLARELHDQMGQELTVLTLGLRSLRREFCTTSPVTTQLEQLQVIVNQLNQQVHDIAWELRPLILDDLGLQVALLTLFEKWSLSTGIKVNFQCSGLAEQRLPEMVETGVYRIIQEALTNVSKHAMARNVVVTLVHFKDRLMVNITDDGRGFDASLAESGRKGSKCLGLLGIQERVDLFYGTLDIVSAPDNGTALRLSIPLSTSA